MNTIKKLLALVLVTVMVFTLTACATNTKTESTVSEVDEVAESEETVKKTADESTEELSEEVSSAHTVTDHLGNEVELPYEINKIVVSNILPLPSVLTIFFDSAEKLVGIAPGSYSAAANSLLSELYPEILNASTDFTDGTTINVEELIKLEPDVIFCNATEVENIAALQNAGLPVVAVAVNKWNYDAIETLNQWIMLLSEIFPDNDKTEICATYSNEIFTMVQDKVKDIPDDERVNSFFLFQYNDTMLSTSGLHFFGQWWADSIGAKNVAEELDVDNIASVNMEQVYGWNPELIFITNFNQCAPEDLYNNTIGTYDWSEIDAVKNQNAYKMPLGMYRSYTPGIDTPITLMWLAKTAYPDIFADVDVTAEVIKYYKEVFGIELTAEQAESIFAPVGAAGSVFD